jgi:fumarate reductase (CoM/CoB) subunit A
MIWDVLIIGGGLAGLTAAASAREQGARVCMVEKGGVGLGSNSAMAHAYFTSPTSEYPQDDYIRDTVEIGKQLNQLSRLQAAARGAKTAFEFAGHTLGMSLESGPNYYLAASPIQAEINGKAMMQDVAASVRKMPEISILGKRQVLEIIIQNGRAAGVTALNAKGELERIRAGAVILATGGAGAVYKHNDNMRSALGQGYFLAAKAGLALHDMEMVQFYPLVMAQPGLPMMMLYPEYPKEAKLINSRGEDLLKKHGKPDLVTAIQRMRDSMSAMIHEESQAGPVYLDLRPVKLGWDKRPLALLRRLKFDFHNQPITLMPGAHFCMGGVAIDHEARTSLPGLFACGEVTWGMHGANRRGGNALTECLVTGLAAGQAASTFGRQNRPSGLGENQQAAIDQSGGNGSARAMLEGMREIAWQRAGIFRDESGMRSGLMELAELAKRLNALPCSTPRDLVRLENLKAGLFTLKAVLTAGLMRKESRGAMQRTDYPNMAEEPQNSCLVYDPKSGDMTVEMWPVVAQ